MDDALCRAKLVKIIEIIEIEGYYTLARLLGAVFSDAVSPAISMNEGCAFPPRGEA